MSLDLYVKMQFDLPEKSRAPEQRKESLKNDSLKIPCSCHRSNRVRGYVLIRFVCFVDEDDPLYGEEDWHEDCH